MQIPYNYNDNLSTSLESSTTGHIKHQATTAMLFLTILTAFLCSLSAAAPTSATFIDVVNATLTTELSSSSAAAMKFARAVPILCGIHSSPVLNVAPGGGFNLCEGHHAIFDFCSAMDTGGKLSDDDHLISPTAVYYPTPNGPDRGIVLSLTTIDDPSKCTTLSVPPADSPYCVDGCDRTCYNVLHMTMNDCDVTTQLQKMGGTMVTGCSRWSIFSASAAEADNFAQFSGGGWTAAMCKHDPTFQG